jgi:hypothetical protein
MKVTVPARWAKSQEHWHAFAMHSIPVEAGLSEPNGHAVQSKSPSCAVQYVIVLASGSASKAFVMSSAASSDGATLSSAAGTCSVEISTGIVGRSVGADGKTSGASSHEVADFSKSRAISRSSARWCVMETMRANRMQLSAITRHSSEIVIHSFP